MIVCTIMGHIVIHDFSMLDQLDRAIAQIVSLPDPDNEVEFLLCGDVDTDLFHWACICIKGYKEDYSHNHITATYVAPKTHQKALEKALVRRGHLVDRVVAPELPSPVGKANRVAYQSRLIRWCIEQSDHIISYVYLPLVTTWNRPYQYAKERGVNIIDIIDPQTQDYILEHIACMRPRQQQIFQSIQEGKDLNEIAAQHDISVGHLNWIIQREAQKLTDALRRRLNDQCRHGNVFDFRRYL